MTLGGLWARGIPAVFWQTGRKTGVFSTGTEMNGLSGFSGMGWDEKNGDKAQFRLIFTVRIHDHYVPFQGSPKDRHP
jgi:hypothetical protein